MNLQFIVAAIVYLTFSIASANFIQLFVQNFEPSLQALEQFDATIFTAKNVAQYKPSDLKIVFTIDQVPAKYRTPRMSKILLNFENAVGSKPARIPSLIDDAFSKFFVQFADALINGNLGDEGREYLEAIQEIDPLKRSPEMKDLLAAAQKGTMKKMDSSTSKLKNSAIVLFASLFGSLMFL